MKNRLLLFLPLVIALALGAVFYASLDRDPRTLESARIGQPVPAFQLSSLQQPEQQLDNQLLKGKVQLLNVWATWCPSCAMEHPYLMHLAEQGVPVVGLNYKDDRDKAKAWLTERGNPYTKTLFDPKGRLGFDLGVYGAPETYIVDADGIVRYRRVGVVDDKVWKEKMKPVFDQYSGGDSP
ncbi:DsbE family thiol:disulfide interchange protein [Marinobacteraceae bacterium S3BR75-40.1]